MSTHMLDVCAHIPSVALIPYLFAAVMPTHTSACTCHILSGTLRDYPHKESKKWHNPHPCARRNPEGLEFYKVGQSSMVFCQFRHTLGFRRHWLWLMMIALWFHHLYITQPGVLRLQSCKLYCKDPLYIWFVFSGGKLLNNKIFKSRLFVCLQGHQAFLHIT